jgi:hypothetical protein
MPRENLQSQRALAEAAHRLTLIEKDLDPLIDLAGDAVFVLLGEASHGTQLERVSDMALQWFRQYLRPGDPELEPEHELG